MENYGQQCGPSTTHQKRVPSGGECSNILPTFDNLYLKRTQIDQICTVCNQQRETGVHILWECLFACNVWALVKDKIQKSPAATLDFFMLTRTMM